MTRTVLVTGARGKTGRGVVDQLRSRPGVTVRAGSSQPGQQRNNATGQPVRFDWHEPATWHEACAGVNAIYLMRPDLPQAPDLVAELVELAPSSHIVLLSEQSAERLPDDHWVRRVESAVVERGRTWTLLRPSWFQQVLTDERFFRDAIRHDRILSLPSGGAPIAWVDAYDIASVAVTALLHPGDHQGQAYTITGPEAVTVAAIAESLSAHLGEPVSAIDPPIAEVVNGLDPWTTDILEGLYQRVWQGDFAKLSHAVEAITGRKPQAIEQFIGEHRHQWIA